MTVESNMRLNVYESRQTKKEGTNEENVPYIPNLSSTRASHAHIPPCLLDLPIIGN